MRVSTFAFAFAYTFESYTFLYTIWNKHCHEKAVELLTAHISEHANVVLLTHMQAKPLISSYTYVNSNNSNNNNEKRKKK